MNELHAYCNEQTASGGFNNDADHCQARVFQSYIIATLLGVTELDTVKFYQHGTCYRVAMFC